MERVIIRNLTMPCQFELCEFFSYVGHEKCRLMSCVGFTPKFDSEQSFPCGEPAKRDSHKTPIEL